MKPKPIFVAALFRHSIKVPKASQASSYQIFEGKAVVAFFPGKTGARGIILNLTFKFWLVLKCLHFPGPKSLTRIGLIFMFLSTLAFPYKATKIVMSEY